MDKYGNNQDIGLETMTELQHLFFQTTLLNLSGNILQFNSKNTLPTVFRFRLDKDREHKRPGGKKKKKRKV